MVDAAVQPRVRIMGIDPGSRVTGYGVIDHVHGRSRPVTWGVVQAWRGDADTLPLRLRRIFEELSELAVQLQPDEVAIERVFVNRNVDSALKLGQARGAALCAVFASCPEVYEYSAREIKQAVVGRGGADKRQVQHMMRVLLNLPETPGADAADALAVALCHAHTRLAPGVATGGVPG